MYTYYMFDKETYVVKNNDIEFCICSEYDGEEKSPEERAKFICESLNYQEKAKFITMDKSEDYGKMSFGVNLNEQSDEDYSGINVWNELDNAISEKDELAMRDIAGEWAVFAVIEIEPTILYKEIVDNE